jgi:hypothetical protein
MIQINLYMNNKEFPKELQARIRRHLEYIFEGEKNSKFTEKSLFDLLSINLKDEVVMAVNRKSLFSSNFFWIEFSSLLFANLPFLMSEKNFVPDEVIIYEEDISKTDEVNMYFITSGKVLVFIERTQTELLNMEVKPLRKEFYYGRFECIHLFKIS